MAYLLAVGGVKNLAVAGNDLCIKKAKKRMRPEPNLELSLFMYDPQCGVPKGAHKLRLKPLNHPPDSGERWETRAEI